MALGVSPWNWISAHIQPQRGETARFVGTRRTGMFHNVPRSFLGNSNAPIFRILALPHRIQHQAIPISARSRSTLVTRKNIIGHYHSKRSFSNSSVAMIRNGMNGMSGID